MKKHLAEKYFPRIPNKRAVLLPALHYIQHTLIGFPCRRWKKSPGFSKCRRPRFWIRPRFTRNTGCGPKGEYLLQVCRSLTCEVWRLAQAHDHLSSKLNLPEGETTADGRYTLWNWTCLGACGTAPSHAHQRRSPRKSHLKRVDELIAKPPKRPCIITIQRHLGNGDGH